MAQLAALGERYRQTEYNLDRRAAQICMVLANIFRDQKKKPGAYKVEDFIPGAKTKPKEMTEADMKVQLEMMTAAFGGKVEKDG